MIELIEYVELNKKHFILAKTRGGYIKESNCFKTKEEALKYAEKLAKKLKF